MAFDKQVSHFSSTAIAVSVVTNCWEQSTRFYMDALGYKTIDQGVLTKAQKETFGEQLHRYCLFGQDRGAVIRLIESTDPSAVPNRINARPWDPGLCVMEIGVMDVEKAYLQVIRNRFGVLAPPKLFTVDGPEPLGYIEMLAMSILAPAGEQIFLTQITHREGGIPLWEQRKDINVFPLGNVVMSMEDRKTQEFYQNVFHIYPETDLVLRQDDAAFIMGGPKGMGFDMCLMGNGDFKAGLEQHVYGPHNDGFEYNTYPCDFSKTGLASACWQGTRTEGLNEKINTHGGQVIGKALLPIRDNREPSGIVFKGPLGEIIELVR